MRTSRVSDAVNSCHSSGKSRRHAHERHKLVRTVFRLTDATEETLGEHRVGILRLEGVTGVVQLVVDHRVDEAVLSFVADGSEEVLSSGERAITDTGEASIGVTEVTVVVSGGHAVNSLTDDTVDSVANNAVDELLTLNDSNFLVPVEVGHRLDKVSIDGDVTNVEGLFDLTFLEVRCATAGDVDTTLVFTGVADNELKSRSITTVLELILEILTASYREVCSGLCCTESDQFGLTRGFKAICHF